MASPPPVVVFVNDRAAYNDRYRRPVMDLLSAQRVDVHSIGFFDGPVAFAKSLRRVLGRNASLIVSSNLRTNLLMLLLPTARTLFIVNGLGRLREKSAFRWLVRAAIGGRPRCLMVIQSYADYRYLRRFVAHENLLWLPGSGGRRKPYGEHGGRLVVQRDRKIAAVAKDVNRLFDRSPGDGRLVVVGCDDDEFVRGLFPGVAVRFTGYVAGDLIFQQGGTFLQPSGYGEGFPHTLADAIASDMPMLISNREYVRYGLHRIGARRRPVCFGWSRLDSSPTLRQNVSEARIARATVDLLPTPTLGD